MIVLHRTPLLALGLVAGAAWAEPPRVVVDIAPSHSLVARVMEGVGAPALLLEPGTSPHDHAMRPSEAGVLAEAELVVLTAAELTPWLDRAADRLAPDAAKLMLDEAPGAVVLPAREAPLLEDHDHDHGHDHGETDPHGWLDPHNARAWMDAVAEVLAERDPENAVAYRANAEAGRAELEALEAELRAALDPVRGLRYVVLHDAFQYFEARFDVPAVAALAVGDATDPGPARLREIHDALRREAVACAFAEPQLDPGLLTAVAGEVPTAVLDPLGASLEPGPDLYPALLRDLARALADCA